jgi:Fimbrial assembly protein (PilN)
MREVEFLPTWYPQVRLRRRIVLLQAWMVLVVIAGLALWTTLAQRNVHQAQATLLRVDAQLAHSRNELKTLEELMTLGKKLGEQAQVLAKVGSHVEAARLLATLDEVMPKSTALLELSFLTEEKAPLTLAAARAAQEKDRSVERKVNVKITGVAPTDVEVAEFLTRLTGKPFFEDVRMTGSKPRLDNGHVMREFEVSFSMNLNAEPTGA